jgi:hypothetical protein
MDFSSNRAQPQPAAQSHPASSRSNKSDDGKWTRIGVVAAIAAVVILLLGLIVFAASGNSSATKEGDLVKSDKLQAVFLNTGQVYFGNIKSLNNKYLELSNIYYLQTNSNGQTGSNQQQNNTNVSLVKLGCELHEPFDRMVINRDSVTFWENLQDGGQVATAVKKFEQQNPNGQKCTDQSNSSSTNSGNSAQPAGNNNSSNSSNSTTR